MVYQKGIQFSAPIQSEPHYAAHSRSFRNVAKFAIMAATLLAACDTIPYPHQDLPSAILTIEGEGTVEIDTLRPSGEQPLRLLLTGIPDEGWYLARWEGDSIRTGNPDTLTLLEDEEVSAVFLQQTSPVYFDGIPFVEIPAGTFEMGGDGDSDELPRHAVAIPGHSTCRCTRSPSRLGRVSWAAIRTRNTTICRRSRS